MTPIEVRRTNFQCQNQSRTDSASGRAQKTKKSSDRTQLNPSNSELIFRLNLLFFGLNSELQSDSNFGKFYWLRIGVPPFNRNPIWTQEAGNLNLSSSESVDSERTPTDSVRLLQCSAFMLKNVSLTLSTKDFESKNPNTTLKSGLKSINRSRTRSPSELSAWCP